MVFRNQKEQGNRLPVDLRLGATVERFGGLDLENDASAISDGRFRALTNVRKTKGPYRERGGQVKMNNSSMGLVEGFMDASDIGAVHAGVAATIEGGAEFGFGRYLYFTLVDPGNTDDRQLARFDTQDLVFEVRDLAAGEYRGLYIGVDQEIYAGGQVGSSGVVVRLHWTDPVVIDTIATVPAVGVNGFGKDGIDDVDGSGVPFQSWGLSGSIVEDPTTPGRFYATEAFFGTPGPVGRTYLGTVLDDTPGIAYSNVNTRIAAYVAVFNGTVYAAWGNPKPVSGGSGTIRKRTGAATWANLTLPAPPAGYHFAGIGNPVVFQGKLWVAGTNLKDTAGAGTQDLTIFSVTTGDVVTQEHQITSNAPVAFNQAVFQGRLHIFYTNKFLGFTKIAVYNGITWTDVQWDGKIDGVQQVLTGIRRAGDSLWAVAYDGTVILNNGEYWLIKSDGGNTAKWTKIYQITPGNDPFIPLGDLVSRND